MEDVPCQKLLSKPEDFAEGYGDRSFEPILFWAAFDEQHVSLDSSKRFDELDVLQL